MTLFFFCLRWWGCRQQPGCWSRATGSSTCRGRGDFGVQRWKAGDHGGQTLPTSTVAWPATSCSPNCANPAWHTCDCTCPLCPPPTGPACSSHRGTDEGEDYICNWSFVHILILQSVMSLRTLIKRKVNYIKCILVLDCHYLWLNEVDLFIHKVLDYGCFV